MTKISSGIFSDPRARKLLPVALQKTFSKVKYDPNKDANPVIVAHHFTVLKRADWYAVDAFYVMPPDWNGAGKVVTGIVNPQVGTKKITTDADMGLVQDFCFLGLACGPDIDFGNWWLSDLLSIKVMPGIGVELDRYFSKGRTIQEVSDKWEKRS